MSSDLYNPQFPASWRRQDEFTTPFKNTWMIFKNFEFVQTFFGSVNGRRRHLKLFSFIGNILPRYKDICGNEAAANRSLLIVKLPPLRVTLMDFLNPFVSSKYLS